MQEKIKMRKFVTLFGTLALAALLAGPALASGRPATAGGGGGGGGGGGVAVPPVIIPTSPIITGVGQVIIGFIRTHGVLTPIFQ
jgi:hypothetical protein